MNLQGTLPHFNRGSKHGAHGLALAGAAAEPNASGAIIVLRATRAR